MKRFRFQLETLLRVRREREEERKRRLAEAQRLVMEQKGRLTELFDEESRETEAQRRLRQGGVIDLQEVRARMLYSRAVVRRIQEGFDALQDRVADEGIRRTDLLRAAQERRVLEKLRERKWESWRYEAGREEQKRLDEIAGTRVAPRRA